LTSPLASGSMLERLIGLHMQEGQPSHAGADGGDVNMAPTLADPRHPGSLFIDRDGCYFSYILNYLRWGAGLWVCSIAQHCTPCISEQQRVLDQSLCA
jgi:hypothetical protein